MMYSKLTGTSVEICSKLAIIVQELEVAATDIALIQITIIGLS